MSDTKNYTRSLRLFDSLKKVVVRQIIDWLYLPAGSCGLDAGCGIGLQATLLAEMLGVESRVTGMDISMQFVAYASRLVEQAGLSQRVSFKQGDVDNLPFDDNSFDWAWSMDCVGYRPSDPLPALREMARVVRPGGRVILAAYSSQQLLPGYPGLEARLNATSSGIAPFVEGTSPHKHFARALGWFEQAGLSHACGREFVHSIHAPVIGELRDALADLFHMRWGGAEREVATQDWAEYKRLCEPESANFIVDCPDYYAFFTYSVFQGKVERTRKVI